MNKKTRILQIGENSWLNSLNNQQQETLDWLFLDSRIADEQKCKDLIKQMKRRSFDVVICTDTLVPHLLEMLSPLIESYALVLDVKFEARIPYRLKKIKCPIFMSLDDRGDILDKLCQYFFPGQMGSKLHVQSIDVREQFQGDITLSGEHRLALKGKFSDHSTDRPMLTWQSNIGVFGRSKKLWLEHIYDEGMDVRLIVQGIYDGSSQIFDTWKFDAEALRQGIEIPYQEGLGYLSVSLTVMGEGEIQIGPLHYRDSRSHYGEYILGGQKVSDTQNEELYYYFHPGDLKPPLNVYFSGYRSAEGFEGFHMMKKLRAPFLLITDPRLEGGSFYLGSAELESSIQSVIRKHLNQLEFSNQELILSGLSMGTFGALYYGSFFNPHSIIVGKPLVNLGTMAEKERIVRPGGFPTSLDVLQSLTGRQDQEGIKNLNQRFWAVFKQPSFHQTQFVIAYMQDDDYDDRAYKEILEQLVEKDSRVIGKGIPGRHNDNSSAINQWFINHYQRILAEYFQRGKANEIRN